MVENGTIIVLQVATKRLTDTFLRGTAEEAIKEVGYWERVLADAKQDERLSILTALVYGIGLHISEGKTKEDWAACCGRRG